MAQKASAGPWPSSPWRAARRVGLIARHRDELEATLDALGGPAAGAVAVADVAERADVERALAALGDALGPVDVLVNNAGVGAAGHVTAIPVRTVERVLAVNYLGAVYATKAVLPAMLGRGRGHIVTMASVAGRFAAPGEAVYSATKFAVVGFTQALALELHGTGVGVSLVNPGPVDTGAAARRYADYQRRWPRPVPVGDVARAVATAVDRRRLEVFVPRWYRAPAVLQAAASGAVRLLPPGVFGIVPDEHDGDDADGAGVGPGPRTMCDGNVRYDGGDAVSLSHPPGSTLRASTEGEDGMMHRTQHTDSIEGHPQRANRRSSRVAAATVVSVLALGMAACSSSTPGTTTVTYNKAKAQADINHALNTLFNLSKSNENAAIAVLQDGSSLRAAVTQGVDSSLASSSKGAKLDSYKVLSAAKCKAAAQPLPSPCAKVVYDILGPTGTAILPNSQGYVVFENGKWLVSKQTICGLFGLMYQTEGKTGTPPGC